MYHHPLIDQGPCAGPDPSKRVGLRGDGMAHEDDERGGRGTEEKRERRKRRDRERDEKTIRNQQTSERRQRLRETETESPDV